jgi:hypothetical protein
MSPQGRTRSHRTERGIIFITGACGEGREVEAERAGVDVWVRGSGMQQASSSSPSVTDGGWSWMELGARALQGQAGTAVGTMRLSAGTCSQRSVGRHRYGVH